jgi:uncharacterized protein with FMN-binding domain
MKKFVLSMFVIVSFGFYVVWQNLGNSSDNSASPTALIPSKSTQKSVKLVATARVVPVKNNPVPTSTSSPTPKPKPTGQYTDGQYLGNSADAYYGNIQVEAIIQNGKLAEVVFVDYPQDRGTSIRINNRAMPILKEEAISAQSANVNTVSGASDSSAAFRESLASALAQALA